MGSELTVPIGMPEESGPVPQSVTVGDTSSESESPFVQKMNVKPAADRLWCSDRLVGTAFVLLSSLMISVVTLLVEQTGERGIPSFQMIAFRCVFQIFYGATMCLWIGINPFGEPENRYLPVLRGLVGPLATGALYYGATHIPIADATVLKFTSPVWTLLIARIVLKEPIKLLSATAILLGFCGVVLVSQPVFLWNFLSSTDTNATPASIPPNQDPPGSLTYYTSLGICLTGGLSSAVCYVIIRKSGGSVHFHVLGFYYALIGIFSSTGLLYLLQGGPVMPGDWVTWGMMSVIAVGGCLAQTAFNKGAQMIEASKSAAFRSTDVAFVLLWQTVLLHEMPTAWSWGGIVLIFACTLIMASMKPNRRAQSPADDGAEHEEWEYEMDELSDVSSEELVPDPEEA